MHREFNPLRLGVRMKTKTNAQFCVSARSPKPVGEDVKTRNISDIDPYHYTDVIMSLMASQITSLTILYSTVYSDRSKKTSTFRVTGLCEGNSPVTGEFPSQKASDAEKASI